jgi:hypothetical protein
VWASLRDMAKELLEIDEVEFIRMALAEAGFPEAQVYNGPSTPPYHWWRFQLEGSDV